jgi:hypothetical protein
MNRHGFYLIERGRPKKYLHLGHALSLLEHKLENPMVGKGIALSKKLLPESYALRYPAEDLFWALYKKSKWPYISFFMAGYPASIGHLFDMILTSVMNPGCAMLWVIGFLSGRGAGCC